MNLTYVAQIISSKNMAFINSELCTFKKIASIGVTEQLFTVFEKPISLIGIMNYHSSKRYCGGIEEHIEIVDSSNYRVIINFRADVECPFYFNSSYCKYERSHLVFIPRLEIIEVNGNEIVAEFPHESKHIFLLNTEPHHIRDFVCQGKVSCKLKNNQNLTNFLGTSDFQR